METKDKLTLGIAVLAFLVSAVSTAITIVRGRREKQRAIRNDITNVLSQIVENSLENARLFNESQGQFTPFYQRASAILNQRNNFLLHQGVYLSEQLPELVTAVEYNTLAVAHADSGDLLRAESYYEKAIVASRDDYYRSIATRSLAVFLFQQHRLAEARRNFEFAIGLLLDRDQAHYAKGITYQTWGLCERDIANEVDRAKYCFYQAEKQFAAIENVMARNNCLTALQAAKTGVPIGPPGATNADPRVGSGSPLTPPSASGQSPSPPPRFQTQD